MKSFNQSIAYRFSISLFFILFLSLFNLSYSQSPIDANAQSPASTILPEKAMFLENIPYKKDNTGNPVLLDIYEPKKLTSEKLPVVIYVHGGAWAKGDKIVRTDSYIESFILKLVEKNYVVISIDYTLVSENVHFPEPIQDTKDAVKWVRKNAEKYNFDVNNIGYFGASSGAHLSMLAAYSNDTDYMGSPDLSSYSGKVNYVVSNFGPTDLNKLLHTRLGKVPVSIVGLFFKPIVEIRQKLVFGISGYDIKKDKRKAVDYLKTVSPINDVENAVPTFILHGDKDKVAPINHSKRLVRKLKKQNIETSLIVVKDGVHGFGTTDKTYMNQLNDDMVSFIVSHKK
ncbi:acetyl esterase/lipase [Chryseobacterium ginsenosidimutans]|uniref:alpha/beta hydrolase n=1 Tax=Chryseobacterium ginsenosidimutans TaxID=687846 RepID=UPI00278918ED|nr:alpha/beta hydrolase [Chryseobacterium ginsenosidimutans]MDQ0595352.1 acetyl esterase/lipase [Chryseobacterium ginsenosidimutans]